MNIALYQPEIPQNTGNIGRTCHCTGAKLHLIHPLGFFLSQKALKRAGMDYWDELVVTHYDNLEQFIKLNNKKRMFFVETYGTKNYDEINYEFDDFFIFGSEGYGLPKDIIQKFPKNIIRIPMVKNTRSLNLSVSVGIILYEALRQTGFKNIKQ